MRMIIKTVVNRCNIVEIGRDYQHVHVNADRVLLLYLQFQSQHHATASIHDDSNMLLLVSVVRSTTQKDKAFPRPKVNRSWFPVAWRWLQYLLQWNGQDENCSHRRDCSAWPGWKQRKVLGPLNK